jgi:mannitol operon transcriptional antiterminator
LATWVDGNVPGSEETQSAIHGSISTTLEEFLMLSDYLTEKTIALNVAVKDWQEAIRAAGQLLVETGGVEPRYVEGMIRTAEELGPYIVIAPGIALPHARPEEGVIKNCFSLITLSSPVDFGNEDNDPVLVVIAFGATDQESHVEALAELARAIAKDGFLEKVENTSLKEGLLALFK